jgi:hypothetical protein
MMTQPFEQRADFMERHYTVGELAKAWHMSPNTIRPRFLRRAGVIKYGTSILRKNRKRTHQSLRIPESVARQVYRELTGKDWGAS